jgi:peptidylprolyl isomerase
VRTRPLVALSVAASAALLLTACSSGGSEPDATSTTPAAGGDLCAVAAPSGAASDAVTVEGAEGSAPTATFEFPLEVPDVQRTVVTEGSGDAIETGDYISYALTALDATSGEQLGNLGYAEGEILPAAIAPESLLGSFFGCATVGSRIVTTLPASDQNPSPAVYVLDLLEVTPLAAWGEEQSAPEGLPAVELAEDGEPTVTIPEGDAPADLQLGTLKLGDGPVVEPGDNVLVQYKGVLWSDGSEFDSSWSRDAPASFATTGVVPGFRQALEGQTVGSQVVVVIPPALGYGDADQDGIPAGSTLVFVVDILATQHQAAAPQQ